MTRLLLIILMSVCVTPLAWTQSMSWKKHVKLAEELYEQREYAKAAKHYEEAWGEKPKKKELIFKAGECYYIVRDFAKAAKAYENIKDDNKEFDYIGLKYARCLKQAGQYETAGREFVYFLNGYSGKDKVALTSIVETEIKGCELGIQEQAKGNSVVTIDHLDNNINSSKAEFGPIPFSDDILYFSSLIRGKAKIFRSQRQNGAWTKSKLPKGFKSLEEEHFCNGSFAPDAQRFYFTICEQEQSWGSLSSRCDIYMTERNGSTWTTPEKLPDYINMDGSTTTHPFVVHEGDKELVYFSSNREGGNGSMDIWYTERDLKGGDYSYPTNAGVQINTHGDEITPFYDVASSVLYFSSNGHISLGGYDILKTAGAKDQWSRPENIGTPINSAADDMYYTHLDGGVQGYMVSNRLFEGSKTSTMHEDIFSFKTPVNELMVEGFFFDKEAQDVLENVTLTLYELMDNGQKVLWSAKDFANDSYRLPLIPKKTFILEANKEGYTSMMEQFDTFEDGRTHYSIDFFMEKIGGATVSSPIVSAPTPPVQNDPPVVITTPAQEDYVYEESTPKKKVPTIETSPNYSNSQTQQTTPAPNSSEPIVISSNVTRRSETETTTNSTTNSSSDWNNSTNTNSSTETYTSSTNTYTSAADNSTISDYPNHNTASSSSSTSSYSGSSSELVSDAPEHSGAYYKIQVIAVKTYREESKRYRNIKEFGRLDTEYIVDRGLTRVLLADFFSEDEARDMLDTVHDSGFERAFIVKYQDGKRLKRVR